MTQVTEASPGELTGETAREPEWAAVEPDGDRVTLVPLSGATDVRGGVQVPVDAHQVQSAPYREAGLPASVTPETERALHQHYSLRSSSSPEATSRRRRASSSRRRGAAAPPVPARRRRPLRVAE